MRSKRLDAVNMSHTPPVSGLLLIVLLPSRCNLSQFWGLASESYLRRIALSSRRLYAEFQKRLHEIETGEVDEEYVRMLERGGAEIARDYREIIRKLERLTLFAGGTFE